VQCGGILRAGFCHKAAASTSPIEAQLESACGKQGYVDSGLVLLRRRMPGHWGNRPPRSSCAVEAGE